MAATLIIISHFLMLKIIEMQRNKDFKASLIENGKSSKAIESYVGDIKIVNFYTS